MTESETVGRRREAITTRAIAAIAAVALLAAACGGDGGSRTDPADTSVAATGDEGEGVDADGNQNTDDDAATASTYQHTVRTDLPLPDDPCELVMHVHGQRQNGGTTVAGAIGGYRFDVDDRLYREGDLRAVPFGLLHLGNVVNGIEKLSDPALDSVLEAISSLRDELSAVMDSGLEGPELAGQLLAVWDADDGFGHFNTAWEAWLDEHGSAACN